MGRFDYDEGQFLVGVMSEPEELIGAWQFERFFFDIEFLLDLVAH
jgi:hypothetical protein